jgi:hypothetical protein
MYCNRIEDFREILRVNVCDIHDNLENTSKVILPQGVLQFLQNCMSQTVALMFEIMNMQCQVKIYAGVSEFSASPEQIVMPQWVCLIIL